MRGMRDAGVPARYLDVAPEALPGRPWAFITGGVGSGKTHRACGMLRAYVEANMGRYRFTSYFGDASEWRYAPPKAAFVTAGGYLASVKASFDGDERSRTYRHTPFLVIDDLGQEVPTRWAAAELFDLLNFRYSEELPTVITSQFGRDRIARRLAQDGGEEQALAIASRLVEACEVIDLGKEDRRLVGGMAR